jgi:hypothetical protein
VVARLDTHDGMPLLRYSCMEALTSSAFSRAVLIIPCDRGARPDPPMGETSPDSSFIREPSRLQILAPDARNWCRHPDRSPLVRSRMTRSAPRPLHERLAMECGQFSAAVYLAQPFQQHTADSIVQHEIRYWNYQAPDTRQGLEAPGEALLI